MMTPQNEAELADMVTAANGPLQVKGGGTRPVGKPVEGAAISAAGLSGIVDYEPGALTLVVRAGTPVTEVEAALATEGQRLPFEPMDHRALLGTQGTPTIGGVVAANVSGPRRFAVGAARDFLLGVRLVDGAGRILKNGGRVMKNVTGYDLVKLMAGSYGTLGVLSEASFKVLPVPERTVTLELVTGDTAKAQEAMTRALTSPFEISGAAVLPGEAQRVVLRLEGFSGSVAYRAKKISDLLSGFGDVSCLEDQQANATLWEGVRDVKALADADFVWRVSATARDLQGALLRTLREKSTGALVQLDWGGALAWIGMTAVQAEAAGGAAAVHARLQDTAGDRNRMPGGGHVTLIKADAELRGAVSVFQPEPAPVAALTQGVRAKFDPKGIFNPGLMG